MICSSFVARRLVPFGLLCCALAGTGCRSSYIAATVKNASGESIPLVEVDYPSASFGSQMLAAGAVNHYRFKVLGEGGTKVLWTDAAHKDHSVSGPALHEGDEGRMTVTITPVGAEWDLALNHKP